MTPNHSTPPEAPEPRWPAILALLANGGLFLALPEDLSAGPRWLALVIVAALVALSLATHGRTHPGVTITIGHLLSATVTIFMLWSLSLLVRALPAHREAPVDLLRSAALLWVSNVLVFASWYWRLDAGGPHQRAKRAGHTAGAFLFVQMTLKDELRRERDGRPWSPRFADYLFLAFNTSTALSPTDVPPLSRWAKVLMMTQAVISLTVTVILVGRAINIL
jgi:hypothetical protein